MGEAFIVRKGGAAELVITGQEVITGEYGESIAKFDTVFANVVNVPGAEPEWNLGSDIITNPVNFPQGVRGLDFSPNDEYFAVAHQFSPFISIYKKNEENLTLLASPNVLPPAIAFMTRFSSDSNYLIVGHNDFPNFTIYKRSGDTFTKLANPSGGLPQFRTVSANFSTNDTYLALGSQGNTPLIIYKRSGDTFTRLTPSENPPAIGSPSVHFSTNADYLVLKPNAADLMIYKRSGDTFTLLPRPAILPTGAGGQARFSNNSLYVSVAHANSPFISIYKRSGDTFTKLVNPQEIPNQMGLATIFTLNDKYLALGCTNGAFPRLFIYERNGDDFIKLPNQETEPGNVAEEGLSFTPDGLLLAYTDLSVKIYKTNIETFQEIVKATNSLTLAANTTDIGYALEDGTEGQTKTMMSLFREED